MFRLDGAVSYLVPFGDEHLNDPRYYGWLTDYEVVKTINRLDYIMPVALDDVRAYCAAVMRSKTDLFWAVYYRPEDAFVGTIRISGINWYAGTADVGILIGEKTKWGKGVATDSIRTVGTYLFNALGLRRLTAGLMAVNEPMRKVFLRLGFKEEGRLREQDRYEGAFCDHVYLGCFRDEFAFAPHHPR